jgi:hypothetical protein
MAAMMLCLVVLTSCGDSAQQVAQSENKAKNSVASVDDIFERAKSNKLTSEELQMVTKFVESPATKKIIELNNAMTLRFYKVVTTGKKESLKAAIKNEQNEEILFLLGYSEEEGQQQMQEIKAAKEELFKSLGSSKELFTKIGQVKSKGCVTCANKSAVLQHLNKLEKANLNEILLPVPAMQSKKSAVGSVQGCSWFEWWNSAAFALGVAGCTSVFLGCIALAFELPFPFNVPAMAICQQGWEWCINLMDCQWCGRNC